MPFELMVIISVFLSLLLFSVTMAAITSPPPLNAPDMFIVGFVFFLICSLPSIWTYFSYQKLSRESVTKEYKVNHIGNTPLIMVDGEPINIAGRHDRNWNEETVKVRHVKGKYSMGIWYQSYWSLVNPDEDDSKD